MDGKKIEELRELVEFLKANGIAEFDMEQDDLKVRIKFAGEPAAAGGLDLGQLSRLMASAPAAVSCGGRGCCCGSERGCRVGFGVGGEAA